LTESQKAMPLHRLLAFFAAAYGARHLGEERSGLLGEVERLRQPTHITTKPSS